MVGEARRPVGGLFADRPPASPYIGLGKDSFGDTVPLLTSLEHRGSGGAVQSP